MSSKQDVVQEHFNNKTLEEASLSYSERLLAMTRDTSYSSFTKLQIPYEAPSHPILPSRDEIRQKWTEWSDDRNAWKGRAFRLGAFFVKSNTDASVFQVGTCPNIILSRLTCSQEAEHLLFLRENSQVRVPTLYAAFSDSTLRVKPMHFIVMERIEGETLRADDWMSMGDKSRSIIISRLCEQYKLLRSIPSEGYYGRVQRQGWRSWPSFLRKMDPESSGPFDTYEEFVAALCSSARLCTAMMCELPDFTDRESLYLQKMESTLPACNGRQPVFTHLDPQLRNTIVRRIPGPEGDEDWEVTLIDWEHSGWFPAWMQAWAFEEKLEMMTVTGGKVNRDFSNVSSNEEEMVHFTTQIVKSFGEDYALQEDLYKDLREHIVYSLL